MPAEMLLEGKMTKAADVYSFGMLMWEVVTGKKLFEGLRQSQVGSPVNESSPRQAAHQFMFKCVQPSPNTWRL